MSLRATIGSVAISFMLLCSGCATAPMPGYIGRIDHPYQRKIYGSFDKVVSSIHSVLKKKGWAIVTEAEPYIYERDDRYDDNGYQNLLIITDNRKHFHVVSSTFTHLNVFIHCLKNVCDVEIRYEADTSLVRQFTSTRNDQVAQGILDAVEKDLSS